MVVDQVKTDEFEILNLSLSGIQIPKLMPSCSNLTDKKEILILEVDFNPYPVLFNMSAGDGMTLNIGQIHGHKGLVLKSPYKSLEVKFWNVTKSGPVHTGVQAYKCQSVSSRWLVTGIFSAFLLASCSNMKPGGTSITR